MFRALFLSLALVACGGALRPMAQATAVAGLTISETREQLVVARRSELDACSDTECLDRVTLNWSTPVDLYESARTAHSLLVDAVVVYSIAGRTEASSSALRAAVEALVSSAGAMVASLRVAGVDIPSELDDVFVVLRALSGAL